jgi:hypothetical protein
MAIRARERSRAWREPPSACTGPIATGASRSRRTAASSASAPATRRGSGPREPRATLPVCLAARSAAPRWARRLAP